MNHRTQLYSRTSFLIDGVCSRILKLLPALRNGAGNDPYHPAPPQKGDLPGLDFEDQH